MRQLETGLGPSQVRCSSPLNIYAAKSGTVGDRVGRERGSWRHGWEREGQLETGLGESGAAGDRVGRKWGGWRQGWERVGRLETGLGESGAAGDWARRG